MNSIIWCISFSLASSEPTSKIAWNTTSNLIFSCLYRGVNSILSVGNIPSSNIKELWSCWNWLEVWKGVDQFVLLWQFDFGNVQVIVLLVLSQYVQVFITEEVQLSLIGFRIVNLNFLIWKSFWLHWVSVENLIENIVELDFFAV